MTRTLPAAVPALLVKLDSEPAVVTPTSRWNSPVVSLTMKEPVPERRVSDAPLVVSVHLELFEMLEAKPPRRSMLMTGLVTAWLKETSPDGLFTLVEVECLGACVNAPVVQINDDFYEDLTAEQFKNVLRALRRGERPPIGSQTGRQCSEPAAGPTTLTGIGRS